MKNLAELIKNEESYKGLISAIEYGGLPALFTGVGPVHAANVIGAVINDTQRPAVIVCSDENEGRKLISDIEGFIRRRGTVLGDRDMLFHSAVGVSRQSEHERLRALYAMVSGKTDITVCTINALLRRSIPRRMLKMSSLELKMGEECSLDSVCDMLAACGYEKSARVEGIGQFARRGGILDFWSPSMDDAVRCEFFGDEIDSLGYFDVESQRRTEVIKFASIVPACEADVRMCRGGAEGLIKKISSLLEKEQSKRNKNTDLIKTLEGDIRYISDMGYLPSADRYMDIIYERDTAANMIPDDAVVFMYEPRRISDRAKNFAMEYGEDMKTLIERGEVCAETADFAYSYEEICEILSQRAVVMLDNFTSGRYAFRPRTILGITAKQPGAFTGSMEAVSEDISFYKKEGYRIVVLCADKRRASVIKEGLAGFGIDAAEDYLLASEPKEGQCVIAIGGLSAGAEYPSIKTAIITEGKGTGANRKMRRVRRRTGGQRIESFADLTTGDLVVHEQYGIGRFLGIVKMPVDGNERDYIKIAYAGSDILYVPATALDAVTKYIGAGEDREIKLSKMGGDAWTRTKAKAKGAAKDLAKGLISLQAARMKEIGYAFSPDSPWQAEFEDDFEYRETDDQLICINEIKRDMERPVPMDRLLCGDVGYGKTEVALRAVMKCVMEGKQAAILVPTTVLAQQHFVTVTRRFSKIPVKIDVISRYKTAAQMKKALGEIERGETDIIIGTHRLLQKDIKFKDLGLLVVDEEQRFGVTHKERLKEMSRGVDVLTLSATPIPRTLNMALSGLRDMSTIEEPPVDRQPVQTYVMEHDWGILGDAMRREIARGGQVYYLHNRVSNIENTAKKIAEILGDDVEIAVAHGKMDEISMNAVMERVISGEIQILVCTTIIETGIDIPNVNTLIIEDADKMGLAQLHQIRGRVGRSRRKAYAYMTFRREKVLTEVAEKRLSAIREYAEFNSGFKIAMRDLEIRGAGNILGAEQSGHMISVGYDMYLKILEEAVSEEKGEIPKRKAECSADLLVSAYIPQSYMPSDEERMDTYRRIAHVRSEEDADDVIDELVDRYGDIPKSVNMLIRIALLRGEAGSAGFSDITQRKDALRFKVEDFNMKKISALYVMPRYKNTMKVEAGKEPVISLRVKAGDDVIKIAIDFIRAYKSAAAE